MLVSYTVIVKIPLGHVSLGEKSVINGSPGDGKSTFCFKSNALYQIALSDLQR